MKDQENQVENLWLPARWFASLTWNIYCSRIDLTVDFYLVVQFVIRVNDIGDDGAHCMIIYRQTPKTIRRIFPPVTSAESSSSLFFAGKNGREVNAELLLDHWIINEAARFLLNAADEDLTFATCRQILQRRSICNVHGYDKIPCHCWYSVSLKSITTQSFGEKFSIN